jgi:hypothetical protein
MLRLPFRAHVYLVHTTVQSNHIVTVAFVLGSSLVINYVQLVGTNEEWILSRVNNN